MRFLLYQCVVNQSVSTAYDVDFSHLLLFLYFLHAAYVMFLFAFFSQWKNYKCCIWHFISRQNIFHYTLLCSKKQTNKQTTNKQPEVNYKFKEFFLLWGCCERPLTMKICKHNLKICLYSKIPDWLYTHLKDKGTFDILHQWASRAGSDADGRLTDCDALMLHQELVLSIREATLSTIHMGAFRHKSISAKRDPGILADR